MQDISQQLASSSTELWLLDNRQVQAVQPLEGSHADLPREIFAKLPFDAAAEAYFDGRKPELERW
jgi:hypothetical protein